MFDAIRKKLEGVFVAQWAALGGGVKYALPNVAFKQPEGPAAEFVRLSILAAGGELKSIGRKQREEQSGIVMVQIFTPKNKGTKRSRQIADWTAPIFRYKQFREDDITITFHDAPELRDVGERTDFFQQNLVMPYRATKIFAVAQGVST